MMEEQLVEVPASWDIAELREIATKLVDGSHNPPAKQLTGLPMLSATSIANNQINYSSGRLIQKLDFEKEAARTRIQSNDILLTIVGTIGRSAVVPNHAAPFTLQRSVAVISVLPIEPKFIMYQFESLRLSRYIDDKSKGTAQKGIYLNSLGNAPIIIAPINEQKRIVDKIERLFSKLDEGEALLKQVQQQLAVYRQSVLKAAVTGELTKDWREANQHRLESGEALLQRILQARRQQWQGRGKYKEPTLRCSLNGYWGWVEGPLEVFCGIKGGATVDAKRQLANPIEIPYLRVANVQDGFLDLAQIKTIRIEKSKLEELLLEKGDVLFTEGGDIDKLGRGWVWEGQIDLCTHQNHIFRGRPFSDDILSKFISFYCGSLGKEYFLEQGKQTTNLASISLTKLKAFPIALPSPAEQSEIINIVEDLLSRISTLETWCATELARSASLRQSILKDAFSGKLVEHDPNDEPASELLKRIQAAKAAVKKAPARKRQ